MPRSGAVGAVVVGAGPYGLAASAHLSARRIEHRTFGVPMGGWTEHMPVGMFLKSTARDSSIGAPRSGLGIGDWCATAGVDPYDKDGSETPIPIDQFVEYGMWFQQQEVPGLEPEQVARIARSGPGGSGFDVELASGERLRAAWGGGAAGPAPSASVPPARAAPRRGSDWAASRISHSSDHRDLSGFGGDTVAVIGRGQSALETAVLLREAGAEVHLLVRSSALIWGGLPDPHPTFLDKLRSPPAPLGDGWMQLAITRYAGAYRYLPDRVRLAGVQRILGPFGAWWLEPRFEGIEVRLETTVSAAAPHADRLRLDLVDGHGAPTRLDVDHVIAATGYRVDVRSLDVLSDELTRSVTTLEGSPRLSGEFESSVPGLFFSGLAAAATFGPMLRFVCGSVFSGPRVAEGVTARLRSG